MISSEELANIRHPDVIAIAALGVSFEEAGRFEEAALLYRVGIHFGDNVCITRFADMLSEPPEYKDIPKAIALYEYACAAEDAAGCRNLAILYKQLGKLDLHDKYMALAKTHGDPWQEE